MKKRRDFKTHLGTRKNRAYLLAEVRDIYELGSGFVNEVRKITERLPTNFCPGNE